MNSRHAHARRLVSMLLGSCAWIAAASSIQAQDYPQKPIRMIVPFAAGGPTDAQARELARRMADGLGKPVFVENRSGSGGNIGAEVVARAPADGYTLLFSSNGPLAGNLSLFKTMAYHPVKDFAPISNYSANANVLAVHPSFPANTLAEFVAVIKEHPGKYSFTSGGNGTTQHLSGELLKTMAKIDMQHIPYKGESPAILETLSGLAPITFCNVSSCMGYVHGGKLRAIAITAPRRLTIYPQLAAIAETYPGFDVRAWYGLVAPAGTPAAIVQRLSALVNEISQSDDMRARFESQGIESMANSPEAFAAFIHSEIRKWAELIAISGARIE
ncbi:tripartite tricarboxylate transporter substrate binding protein [Verminephrobacter eiseniae]|uniref:tripartite tricarboxylate transporter substrate binding protein n=1 Tax=Verminephrobacter eiseniae TaxID=364317 RepID=UPI002237E289|nr:tripartite tricarboxylate transporter substrate binding protein [Verminephrobacter eiseniae]MCW5235039.1 tripartite tricarboxylate transporter substrate binding protein [Verminephrobacter eiseniae]